MYLGAAPGAQATEIAGSFHNRSVAETPGAPLWPSGVVPGVFEKSSPEKARKMDQQVPNVTPKSFEKCTFGYKKTLHFCFEFPFAP